jgi:hypothetical protein
MLQAFSFYELAAIYQLETSYDYRLLQQQSVDLAEFDVWYELLTTRSHAFLVRILDLNAFLK